VPTGPSAQRYVIQVSDRRFLWFEPDDKVRRIDDESNKSVLWAHLNAFAFTGIGSRKRATRRAGRSGPCIPSSRRCRDRSISTARGLRGSTGT
jgi:hypothetical protein